MRSDKHASLKPFVELKRVVEQKRHQKDYSWRRLGALWHDGNVSLSITASHHNNEQVTVANRRSVEKSSNRELEMDVDMEFGFYLHTRQPIDDDDVPQQNEIFFSSLVLCCDNPNLMNSLLRDLKTYSFLVYHSPFSCRRINIKSWHFLEAPSTALNAQQRWTCPQSLQPLQSAPLQTSQTQQDKSPFIIIRDVQNGNNESCAIVATCTRNESSDNTVQVHIICFEGGFPVSNFALRPSLIDWKQFGLSVRSVST